MRGRTNTMVLPRHIHARRNGWGETEYDEMGEQAPLSWRCACGAAIMVERCRYDEDGDYRYVRAPQAELDEFRSEHDGCGMVEVDQHLAEAAALEAEAIMLAAAGRDRMAAGTRASAAYFLELALTTEAALQ